MVKSFEEMFYEGFFLVVVRIGNLVVYIKCILYCEDMCRVIVCFIICLSDFWNILIKDCIVD